MELFVVLYFVAGLGLLAFGAELFVRGAARLAASMGISPLVIGLTVVAFGTSAPETAVGIQSGLAGESGVSLGNVVGSNIINVLLILGLSAVIAPLVIARQLIRLDVPIMIGAAVLALAFGADGALSRGEGLVFLAAIAGYVFFSVYRSRKESPGVREEYGSAYGLFPASSLKRGLMNTGLLIAGFGMLLLGSDRLVESAVTMATALGVSKFVIGLTIVAIGTSLPEIATSVIATVRGERDIVVGNIVGSNIFNIFLVLGATSLVSSDGLAVPAAALHFDIPVMVVVSIACLPVFFTGYVIARWEGMLFLGYFFAYMIYVALNAEQHEMLPLFSAVMLLFVIPLTAVTLVTVTWRSLRARRG